MRSTRRRALRMILAGICASAAPARAMELRVEHNPQADAVLVPAPRERELVIEQRAEAVKAAG